MEDQLQHQRFERKYLITERQALQIRSFVQCYLVPDQFSNGRPDYSYPVHSLYLDSDALLTYWSTVHCEKNRFKLRVRYYDDNPKSPLFFEIKRRENDRVLKQRAMVHRSAGALLLAGHLPGAEHLVAEKAHHWAALQRFCYLMHKLKARPRVHVAYMREAWASGHNNSVRVTVDRDVRGELYPRAPFNTQLVSPVYPFGGQRVLELKYTDSYPHWFSALVSHFNVVQTGVPKYCGSITKFGEEKAVSISREKTQQKLAEMLEKC